MVLSNVHNPNNIVRECLKILEECSEIGAGTISITWSQHDLHMDQIPEGAEQ